MHPDRRLSGCGIVAGVGVGYVGSHAGRVADRPLCGGCDDYGHCHNGTVGQSAQVASNGANRFSADPLRGAGRNKGDACRQGVGQGHAYGGIGTVVGHHEGVCQVLPYGYTIRRAALAQRKVGCRRVGRRVRRGRIVVRVRVSLVGHYAGRVGDRPLHYGCDDDGDCRGGAIGQHFQVAGDGAASLGAGALGGAGGNKGDPSRQRVGQTHSRGIRRPVVRHRQGVDQVGTYGHRIRRVALAQRKVGDGRKCRRTRFHNLPIGAKVMIAPLTVYKVKGHYIASNYRPRCSIKRERVPMVNWVAWRGAELVIVVNRHPGRQEKGHRR